MEDFYIAFTSRQEAIKMTEMLKRQGVYAELVSTPKELKTGCGLSVKLNKLYVRLAKKMAFYYSFKSLVGFFVIIVKNGKKVIGRI